MNMSNFKVQTGELTTPIIIGHYEAKTEGLINSNDDFDKYGNPVQKVFIKDFKAFAKINTANFTNNDFYAAYEKQKQEDLKFIIKYNSKITYNNYIRFNNTDYEIIYLDNVNQKNEWLVIRASVLTKNIGVDENGDAVNRI